MKLSDVSIRNPVFAWMLMAALIVFGGISFTRLGVSQMPDVDFPVVTVSVALEGAPPEVMETDVADVIEDAVMSVEGIREVSSSSRQGSTSVTIEFHLSRDIDTAIQDVQGKLAQAARLLPREIDPPVVTKTNPEDQPIMWMALSGPRAQSELADIVQNRLKDRFQAVPGVGEIILGGYVPRALRVWLDAARLQAHDLTAADVLEGMRRQNLDLPSGRLESSQREMNLRSESEVGSAEELRELVVAERGGSVVRLGDVALIQDGTEDVRRVARAQGAAAQGLGIRKQRGSNAVEVARGVRARMAEVRKTLPADLDIGISFDGTKPVEEAMHEIELTLVLSVLLTGMVCWLFLGSWSSTLNVVLAIPTSIIGTFAALHFLGFTLNTFTLLALSLSVGIVVDDAIMILENIFRHAEMGKSRLLASIDGAREIGFAAMSATAAIVAIFLPVAFMRGIIGKFFFQFGLTLSIAVALSLLEALTLTPSRCSQFLDTSPRRSFVGRAVEAGFATAARAYRSLLGPTLRHPFLVLGASLAVFGGSLWLVKGLRREMTPSQDIGRVMARIEAPVGSSLHYTDELVRRCEEWVLARPEVERYFASVGGGGGGGGEVTSAVMFVTMKPRDQRDVTQAQLMKDMRAELSRIPSAKVVIQDLSQQGFTAQRGFPVEFSIRGQDWDLLAGTAAEFMERMRSSPLFVDVDTDYRLGMPEVRILPDRDRAADLGVSMEDIAQTVNTLIGGVRAAKYKEGGRRHDIRVRLLRDQRSRPEDLEGLFVRSRSGELVRLRDLVTVEVKPSLLSITRQGRSRAVRVFANVAQGQSQGDALAEIERMTKELLPEGCQLVFSGSAQAYRESFSSLLFALGLGIVVAYMVLASQFNSFLHPVIILMALPFSLSGALASLALFDKSLNIYSMIGVILLMGLAKKNSIVLVDYTNQLRRAGRSRDEALLEACPVRLRPILMTSVATIAGAIPAAIAFGPGVEVRQPMALAVIGGIAVSTFMTLFAVPAAYRVLDSWFGRGWAKSEARHVEAIAATGGDAPASSIA